MIFTLHRHFFYIIAVIDETTSVKVSCKKKTALSGWTGPDAAIYRSFDSSDCLVLMEGITKINYLHLVSGKVSVLKIETVESKQFEVKIDIIIHFN